MTFLLPLVAFALAIAAPLFLRTERGRLEPLRLGVLLVLLLIAALAIFRAVPAIDRMPALVGLVLGGLACALAALLGSSGHPHPTLPQGGGGLAFGVAAASALHLLPATSLPVAGMALVAGSGLGALTVGGETAALAAVLVVAADNLGMRHSALPGSAFVGSQIGLGLAIGAFLSRSSKLGRTWGSVLVAIIAGLAGVGIIREQPLTICIAVGAVAGIVLQFLLADEEAESSRVGLAAIIGVGLATVAFGLGKGVGLGLATLAAVGVLLAVENRRAVLALGPLVGLTLYRVLREAGTGATRALEINQHYTILALVIGLTLPLLPTDWLRGRVRAIHAAGTLLWGIVAVAAAPLVVTAFGMRGGVGLVVGLGISGLVQAFRTFSSPRGPMSFSSRRESSESEATHPWDNERGSSLLPLALGAGLSGATILALSWMGAESSLSRDEKLRLFLYAGAGIAAIAILLALVGRQTQTEVSPTNKEIQA